MLLDINQATINSFQWRGGGTVGGPDSQYPVENSTETEQRRGYRTGYLASEAMYTRAAKWRDQIMHTAQIVVVGFTFSNIRVVVDISQLIVQKYFELTL